MLSVRGVYENGQVRLLESVNYPKHAKAVVIIIEETDPESRETEGMINAREDIETERNGTETVEDKVELSAVTDTSEDFLSKEELDYYFNLESLL